MEIVSKYASSHENFQIFNLILRSVSLRIFLRSPRYIIVEVDRGAAEWHDIQGITSIQIVLDQVMSMLLMFSVE